MKLSELGRWIRSLFTAEPAFSGDQLARRGLAALDAQRYDQTVTDLEHALDLGVKAQDPALLHTVLGRALNALDRSDEAIASHKKALELNPEFHQAWNNLGNTYLNMGDFGEAMRCYQEALRIDPKYVYTYGSMGAVFIKQGHPRKAIKVLEDGIAIDPSVPILHGNLALAYGMAGRFEEAATSLHQSVVLGYKNWETVKDRIENLKALAAHKMDPGTGQAIGHEIPLEVAQLRISMLPTHCPGCGAMVSLSGVHWIGQLEAICPYCSVSLIRPLDD